jgi:ribonuclease VapC
MILDTSALTAMFFREPEAARFAQLIEEAVQCRISVANFLELCMVIEGQMGSDAGRQIDVFMRRAGIVIEPVTVEQGHLARQAFLDFGKGRHSAGLNFGDCFAYALAKSRGEALLFQGRDFRKTDVLAVSNAS